MKKLCDQFREVQKMMKRFGNMPGIGRKMKKGKKGGRVTAKGGPGGGKPPKVPFTLPGLDPNDTSGFPGLN